MKVMTVVGARPQFIKAAPICTELIARKHKNILVHTGQHYDYILSKVFFDELKIPEPTYNLEIGSASAVKQIARMMSSLEPIFLEEKPICTIVFGDTNTTLAAALCCLKCDIPIVHIEGGERNFDIQSQRVSPISIPEESNRILVDNISTIIFCSSQRAVINLKEEGITSNVEFVGDISLDTFMEISQLPSNKSEILQEYALPVGGYVLATVHRALNTDFPERLRAILIGLSKSKIPVIFPVHPRTKKIIDKEKLLSNIPSNSNLRLIEPVGYFDMLALEKNARLIVTDSGGVIREAFFSKIPSIIVDDTTEWIDLVQTGWSQLIGANETTIANKVESIRKPEKWEPILGDGMARHKIVSILEDWSKR